MGEERSGVLDSGDGVGRGGWLHPCRLEKPPRCQATLVSAGNLTGSCLIVIVPTLCRQYTSLLPSRSSLGRYVQEESVMHSVPLSISKDHNIFISQRKWK